MTRSGTPAKQNGESRNVTKPASNTARPTHGTYSQELGMLYADSLNPMSEGLLAHEENIRIRLGPNKEIVSASNLVFDPQHQEEARTMIYEADYLLDYLEEFSTALGLGDATFVSVAEPERQTFYSYQGEKGSSIVLTKAHRGMTQILKEVEE